MLTPLLNQGDLIVYDKEGWASEYFYAVQVEELRRDFYSIAVLVDQALGTGIAINTLSIAYTLTPLEPKEVKPADIAMIYQVRLGLQRPEMFLYIEQLQGSPRRGTFRDPEPVAANQYRAGHYSGRESPEHEPKAEIFVRFSEVPALKFYSNYAFTSDSRMSARGRKIAGLDLELASDARLKSLGLGGAKRADEIIEQLRHDRIPHTHVVAFGLNDQYK